MKQDLKTILVDKKKLQEYLDTNSLWNGSAIVPFSRNKAQWLLANNRMDDSDFCAMLVYEGDELCFFLYFIPDLITTKNGKEKAFWSRRWWVADRYKNSILPTYLKNEATKKLKDKIIIKYIGKETEGYYERQPYTKFSERTRSYILFSLDVDLMIARFKMLRFFKIPLGIIERVSFWTLKILLNRS